VVISFLLYEEVLGHTRLRMNVIINRQEEVHSLSCSLLEDSAFKFYKYTVYEKVDHIDNVIFGVLCLAKLSLFNRVITLILLSLRTYMYHDNIWLS